MGFLLDVIFHFCPPMGTIKTMVFHLSTSWVLLGPWFSVFPENSQAGSTVQKHVWYYWDHGFSFKHPMGTIRTMVFCLSHMWVLLRTWFSKKHSNCCYSTHGFNSAGKSIWQAVYNVHLSYCWGIGAKKGRLKWMGACIAKKCTVLLLPFWTGICLHMSYYIKVVWYTHAYCFLAI